MTVIEKVLLRKDMAAVAVAVVVSMAVVHLLGSTITPLTNDIFLSESDYGATESGFYQLYIVPIFAFLLQVIALEGLLRIVIFARQISYNKGK